MATGKWVLGTIAGLTAVGGFLMDWNKSHLFNPNWPPHAKFHDAWSISIGTFLGAAGLYYLFRKSSDPLQDVKLGTLLPVFYWASQSVSFAFPGTKGLEAEFPELVPHVKGVYFNELPVSAGMLVLSGLGYALERREQQRQ